MIVDGGGSGGSSKMASLPHPTPFIGSEPSTRKRTMQFETWCSQINSEPNPMLAGGLLAGVE
jgi:hypothetical protein